MTMFIRWRYFLVWMGDAIVVSVSIFSSILLYNLFGPIIGKAPLSEETMQYLSNSIWRIIAYYTIPLYIMGIIDGLRDEKKGVKGHILVVFTAVFGAACFIYWIKRGISIKTFSVLFLLSLLSGSFIWRMMLLSLLIERKEELLGHVLPRIRDYLRGKPSAPFILAFMGLLVLCAFLLILKKTEAAEGVANWAYLMLVIGVVIELVQTIRKKGNRD